MKAKLTLHIEKSIIEESKKYAMSQGRSLSSIVEEFLKSVTRESDTDVKIKLSPLVASLYGSVYMDEQEGSYDEILGQEISKKFMGE